MAKFTFTLSIGYAIGNHVEEVEIDDGDLEGLEGEKLEEFMHKEWTEWAWNYIDGGWYPEGETVPRW